MKDAVDHEWGDYYISGLQKGKKKNWILETIYQINQLIPSFNEVFDRETFYVFVFLVIAASIVFIYLMTSVFKIKVREHDVNIHRKWRDWKPANAYEGLKLINKPTRIHQD